MNRLTAKQVLSRMEQGQLPTLKGGYTSKAVFTDGATASHEVMVKLLKRGQVKAPAKSSIYSTFTLNR